MEFQNKKESIKRAQTVLNIGVDGSAGYLTWKAIGDFVGVDTKDKPVFLIIPLVQKELGLTNDGKDGPKTWAAIVEILEAEKPTQTIPSQGKYKETIKLSPQTNGKYAQKITPKAIVMHHASGGYDGAIDWTSRIHKEDGSRLYASYHCILKRNGERTITNDDDNRAYHSGVSSFKGRQSLNAWSIGVSFEGDTYLDPLQDSAIESAIEYIIPRMKKWGIGLGDVTDHRTVAPNRKTDLKKEEFEKFHAALSKAWKKL